MTIYELTNRLRSVHPLVKQIYYFRILYTVVAIVPMFSALYESNRGAAYFIVWGLCAATLPHIAFIATCMSRDPKRVEFKINQNVDIIAVAIWAPMVHFNPMILIQIFIAAAMSGKLKAKYVFWRFVRLFITMGVGGYIFGFQFNAQPHPRTIIFTGIAIVLFSYTTFFILNRTTLKISKTRKKLKAQKQALEVSLLERQKAYKKLEDDLRIAESYVRHMLPIPIKKGSVQTNWLFYPSAMLGGDAFGHHWLDTDNFAFYLLDVSGHGVGAALFSVSVLNALRAQSLKNADFKYPHQVLMALNETFPSENHDDMFFTIWYGVFNQRRRTLKYASAGHPPAILLDNALSKNSEAKLLKCPNIVIGGFPGTNYMEDILQIEEGKALYVYSDGVYEVRQTGGTMWRFDEFHSFLKQVDPIEGSRINQLYNHVRELKGAKSLDDDFSIMEIVFLHNDSKC